MAFLDNSGDIILDAVLTDTGRFRLAKGDGSFKIAKFALGDDEVNYELYNRTHSSGSAYYDLEILRSPVLEAFTNNASSMKSKLITIPRNNLLYLPILSLNEVAEGNSTSKHSSNMFIVAVDTATFNSIGNSGGSSVAGVVNGETLVNGAKIRVDQGLDTTDLSPSLNIDSDLYETQYVVEMDNRLGKLASTAGNLASISYIDDDSIASYFLTEGTDSSFIRKNDEDPNNENPNTQVISGPRGTILELKIQASVELNTSNYFFQTIGTENVTIGGTPCDIIDTLVRVQGATTGASLDIPVRFAKKR
tara:strand:- start:105301 stop:106218 length:918 start_codon:yes stop_codon:yes gene_type:complete